MYCIRFSYDSPASLFRIYQPNECDPKDGYPYVWDSISEQLRFEWNYECLDCGQAYRAHGDTLTVHHFNACKADCRRENLEVLCWRCHKMNHCDTRPYKSYRCPHCK